MEKCLIGVSGGIDSLFAAIQLKKRKYDVTAVHLWLHSRDYLSKDVEYLLKKNSIKFYYADYSRVFQKSVVDYFVYEYSKGFTPNPCSMCNRDVKLKALIKEADKLGINHIATGHYADIEDGLIKRHFTDKDQSYFLAGIDKKMISRIIFPLSSYSKESIKGEMDFLSIKESEDLCFIKNNYRELLSEKLGKRRGEMIDEENFTVGYHDGFYNYTIGQRKGTKSGNVPHYVYRIDPNENIVFIAKEDRLYIRNFYIDNINLFLHKDWFRDRIIKCSVRFRSNPKKAIFDTALNKVMLLEKQKAVAPGQMAVFYYENKVVGSGRIKNVC